MLPKAWSALIVLQQRAIAGSRLLKREGLRVAHVPHIQASTCNSAKAAANCGPRQSTNEVLMVAPTAFEFNDQTAQDNSFMHSSAGGQVASADSKIARRVLREFAGLYHELSEVNATPLPICVTLHDLISPCYRGKDCAAGVFPACTALRAHVQNVFAMAIVTGFSRHAGRRR